MRFNLILLLFLSTVTFLYSQEVKKITNKNSLSVEEFDVLKSNKKIKNGSYIKNVFGKMIIKGSYRDNKKVGIWEFYNISTGQLEQKYDFDNNKLLFLNSDRSKQDHFFYDGEWIVARLDTTAYIIGGLSDLKLKLMEKAYESCEAPDFPVAGLAIFSLIVSKDGTTKDYKITLSSGNSFEKQLLKFMMAEPNNWIPATYNGQKVESEFIIPMNIKYQIDTKNLKQYNINFDYPKEK